MSQSNGTFYKQVDYDLHGMVGIRLLDASSRDKSAVARQLGPIETPLKREPDICIRFVDRLPDSNVRYLDTDDAGYTDDAFVVLRSKHRASARVQIPMSEVGKRCEIVCERGIPAVPLLVPIVNLTALNKGVVPVHASAFRYKGVGVLTTGWAKGGKTETLLAYMANGAEYVGDEWVYLGCDGKRMYGIPEPIKVWDWHLQEMPQYQAKLRKSEQRRLTAMRQLVRTLTRLKPKRGRGSAVGSMANRMLPLLQRQLFVHMPPRELFGESACVREANLQKVLFVVSHASDEVIAERVDPEEIARRVVFSLQYERLPFTQYYLKSRFAFPGARNEIVERAEERQTELLTLALQGLEVYGLYHPYPVRIPALYEATRHLIADE